MGRDPLAGPVAHLDLVVGGDLVEVDDVAHVEDAEAGDLVQLLDELGQLRPGGGHDAAARQRRRRQVQQPVADAVVVAGLLDGAELLHRREQAGHGALGEGDPVGHLGDPGRSARQVPQDGERPLDGLHSRHAAQDSTMWDRSTTRTAYLAAWRVLTSMARREPMGGFDGQHRSEGPVLSVASAVTGEGRQRPAGGPLRPPARSRSDVRARAGRTARRTGPRPAARVDGDERPELARQLRPAGPALPGDRHGPPRPRPGDPLDVAVPSRGLRRRRRRPRATCSASSGASRSATRWAGRWRSCCGVAIGACSTAWSCARRAARSAAPCASACCRASPSGPARWPTPCRSSALLRSRSAAGTSGGSGGVGRGGATRRSPATTGATSSPPARRCCVTTRGRGSAGSTCRRPSSSRPTTTWCRRRARRRWPIGSAGANRFTVDGGHAVCTTEPERFVPALLAACHDVAARADARTAVAA